MASHRGGSGSARSPSVSGTGNNYRPPESGRGTRTGNGTGLGGTIGSSQHGRSLLGAGRGRARSSVVKDAGGKLSVPKPVNLPSLKKEHAGNDPTVNIVGGEKTWAAAKEKVEEMPTDLSSGLTSGSTWGAQVIVQSRDGFRLGNKEGGLNPEEFPSLGAQPKEESRTPSFPSALSRAPQTDPSSSRPLSISSAALRLGTALAQPLAPNRRDWTDDEREPVYRRPHSPPPPPSREWGSGAGGGGGYEDERPGGWGRPGPRGYEHDYKGVEGHERGYRPYGAPPGRYHEFGNGDMRHGRGPMPGYGNREKDYGGPGDRYGDRDRDRDRDRERDGREYGFDRGNEERLLPPLPGPSAFERRIVGDGRNDDSRRGTLERDPVREAYDAELERLTSQMERERERRAGERRLREVDVEGHRMGHGIDRERMGGPGGMGHGFGPSGRPPFELTPMVNPFQKPTSLFSGTSALIGSSALVASSALVEAEQGEQIEAAAGSSEYGEAESSVAAGTIATSEAQSQIPDDSVVEEEEEEDVSMEELNQSEENPLSEAEILEIRRQREAEKLKFEEAERQRAANAAAKLRDLEARIARREAERRARGEATPEEAEPSVLISSALIAQEEVVSIAVPTKLQVKETLPSPPHTQQRQQQQHGFGYSRQQSGGHGPQGPFTPTSPSMREELFPGREGQRGEPQSRERGPPPDRERGPPPDRERGPPPDRERGPPPDRERGAPQDRERGGPPDRDRVFRGPSRTRSDAASSWRSSSIEKQDLSNLLVATAGASTKDVATESSLVARENDAAPRSTPVTPLPRRSLSSAPAAGAALDHGRASAEEDMVDSPAEDSFITAPQEEAHNAESDPAPGWSRSGVVEGGDTEPEAAIKNRQSVPGPQSPVARDLSQTTAPPGFLGGKARQWNKEQESPVLPDEGSRSDPQLKDSLKVQSTAEARNYEEETNRSAANVGQDVELVSPAAASRVTKQLRPIGRARPAAEESEVQLQEQQGLEGELAAVAAAGQLGNLPGWSSPHAGQVSAFGRRLLGPEQMESLGGQAATDVYGATLPGRTTTPRPHDVLASLPSAADAFGGGSSDSASLAGDVSQISASLPVDLSIQPLADDHQAPNQLAAYQQAHAQQQQPPPASPTSAQQQQQHQQKRGQLHSPAGRPMHLQPGMQVQDPQAALLPSPQAHGQAGPRIHPQPGPPHSPQPRQAGPGITQQDLLQQQQSQLAVAAQQHAALHHQQHHQQPQQHMVGPIFSQPFAGGLGPAVAGSWGQAGGGRVDSFYGAPGTGGVQQAASPYPQSFAGPMMVFNNPFGQMNQFGQLGLGGMGRVNGLGGMGYMPPAYGPTGKLPDWKHTPAAAAPVGMNSSVGAGVVGGPPGMSRPAPSMRLPQGSYDPAAMGVFEAPIDIQQRWQQQQQQQPQSQTAPQAQLAGGGPPGPGAFGLPFGTAFAQGSQGQLPLPPLHHPQTMHQGIQPPGGPQQPQPPSSPAGMLAPGQQLSPPPPQHQAGPSPLVHQSRQLHSQGAQPGGPPMQPHPGTIAPQAQVPHMPPPQQMQQSQPQPPAPSQGQPQGPPAPLSQPVQPLTQTQESQTASQAQHTAVVQQAVAQQQQQPTQASMYQQQSAPAVNLPDDLGMGDTGLESSLGASAAAGGAMGMMGYGGNPQYSNASRVVGGKPRGRGARVPQRGRGGASNGGMPVGTPAPVGRGAGAVSHPSQQLPPPQQPQVPTAQAQQQPSTPQPPSQQQATQQQHQQQAQQQYMMGPQGEGAHAGSHGRGAGMSGVYRGGRGGRGGMQAASAGTAGGAVHASKHGLHPQGLQTGSAPSVGISNANRVKQIYVAKGQPNPSNGGAVGSGYGNE